MKNFILFLVLLVVGYTAISQNKNQNAKNVSNIFSIPMNHQDSAIVNNIPVLKLPAGYLYKSLPAVVDNSTQPYWRPVFQQGGLDCGQAASVGEVFTYEINYVRNLPSNVVANQYPTFYTWNFENGGDGWYGVSYFHSLEIVKTNGNPNVNDFGGMFFGGGSHWMTGYDKYYNGMHNRLYNYYRIDLSNPEGITTLKNWINDHLDGSPVGGIACFYSVSPGANYTLPAGTPEGGKYVVPSWGSPNHALTICGYNDSIRYDYNGNGLYTNNVDINSDGVVNMKDWEIGGFKFANTYSGGPTWANNGFCYMMYKSFAEDLSNGGIWSKSVVVQRPKVNCEPQLAARVILKHNSRDKIQVKVGISTNLSDVVPAYTMTFPIFNYQGGGYFMQGGTTEADKTLEFGLDLTTLLNKINPGQNAKYFLQVTENDPGNLGTGEITHFSIIDYTNGVNEINCTSSNVPIIENGVTTLSVAHAVNYSDVDITNTTLPQAIFYQPYSYQLNATGGTAPYKWTLARNYTESASTTTFPAITTELINLNNDNSGWSTKQLPFSFPYFDKTYSSVQINADGYLTFGQVNMDFPYTSYNSLKLRNIKMIAPYFMNLNLNSADGDGVWYEGDQNSVTIRWKTSASGSEATTEANFAVKLYPSGNIEYFYGNMVMGTNSAQIGISNGDDDNYQFASISETTNINTGTKYTFLCPNYPPEMTLSEDGIYSGVPLHEYVGTNVRFKATDLNNISSIKTLQFTTDGILMDFSIVSGTDEIIENGETVNVSAILKNLSATPTNNVSLVMRVLSPYVTISDSLLDAGTLQPSLETTFTNAFAFNVMNTVPDGYTFIMRVFLTANGTTVSRDIEYGVNAPHLEPGIITVNDGNNNRLDPGDVADINVQLNNVGGAHAYNILATISTTDPYITINNNSAQLDTVLAQSSGILPFNITVSGAAPVGHIVDMTIQITADNGYSTTEHLYISIGLIVEDFETGNYSAYSWYFGGNANWVTDTLAFNGDYSSRSGNITHVQETDMIITLNVLNAGTLSFMKKVSSEANYDYLKFYIDGIEKNKWSGDVPWSEESYPVASGMHTFTWKYMKDVNVSSGMDHAWVDDIIFPAIDDQPATFSLHPDSFDVTMPSDALAYDTLFLSNTGGGLISYTIDFQNTNNAKLANHQVKSILGSYINCSDSVFHPGFSYAWNFTVHNMSSDSEWLRDIYFDFPDGIRVDSVWHFLGGSGGAMLDDTVTGNGVTVHWHGADQSGWGVVRGNEQATAKVFFTIDTSFAGDLRIPYQILGDVYGAVPHEVSDTIIGYTYGLIPSWISLSAGSGDLLLGGTDTLLVTFNSTGLDQGDYNCKLLVTNSITGLTEVPVMLHVRNIEINPLLVEKNMYSNTTDTSIIQIHNSISSGINYTATVSANALGWLSVNPANGFIPADVTNNVTFNFNTTGMNAGQYTAQVTIQQGVGYSAVINVLLTVSDIKVNPSSVQKIMRINKTETDTVDVINMGNGNFFYMVEALDNAGQTVTWLNLSPETAILNSGDTNKLALTFSTSNLLAGDYSCNVKVTNNNGFTANVSVSLHVNKLMVNPDPIQKNLYVNVADSSLVEILLGNYPATAYSLQILPTPQSPDASWLLVELANGTVNTDNTQAVYIKFNTSGIAVGNYSYNLQITEDGNYSTTVPVVLNVFNMLSDPEMIVKNMTIDCLDTDSLNLFNLSNASFFYMVETKDTLTEHPVNWLLLSPNTGVINAASTNQLLLNFNTNHVDTGSYFCNIIATNNSNCTHTIPVTLNVTPVISVPEISDNKFNLRAYPNPFSDKTTLSFTLHESDNISLEIVNVHGQKIKTIFNNQLLNKGEYQLEWNCSNEIGVCVSDGVYFYRFTGNKNTLMQKIILRK